MAPSVAPSHRAGELEEQAKGSRPRAWSSASQKKGNDSETRLTPRVIVSRQYDHDDRSTQCSRQPTAGQRPAALKRQQTEESSPVRQFPQVLIA